MTDTTALAIRRPAPLGGYQPPPDKSEFEGMIVMANNLSKANGFIPTHFYMQPYKILAAMLFARDLGLTSTYALQHLFVVEGKVGMDGLTAASLIWRAGHTIHPPQRVKGQLCTVTITRGDTRETFEETFTMADAKDAGLMGKDPWKKYPDSMLYWRALMLVARTACPDALGGVSHTAEELGADVNDQGEPLSNGSGGQLPAAQSDIPLSKAAAGSTPPVSGASEAGSPPAAIQPTPPASSVEVPPRAPEGASGALGADERSAGPDPAATTPPPPQTAAVMPLSGPAFSRRMGVGRSVGPAAKRVNVVTAEPQASEKPATAPEGAQQQVGPPEAIPARQAPPDLVEEPVSAAPVEDGLAPQRQLLRQAAAELAHVNAILFNKVTAPLENKALVPVPPATPSDASDEGLARLVDRDFPGRTVANLDAAGLQNRLELVESNLAKKKALMAERGITAE